MCMYVNEPIAQAMPREHRNLLMHFQPRMSLQCLETSVTCSTMLVKCFAMNSATNLMVHWPILGLSHHTSSLATH